MSDRPDIAIFGAGAWGTALSMAWGREGAHVALWGIPAEAIQSMASTRHHPRLPNAELPISVRPVTQVTELFRAPIWISALPTQVTPDVWAKLEIPSGQRPELLFHVSKGILLNSHQRLSEVLEPMLKVPVGVLSGPTFSDEVARDLPAALVMALPPTIEEERAQQLQTLLATPQTPGLPQPGRPGCGTVRRLQEHPRDRRRTGGIPGTRQQRQGRAPDTRPGGDDPARGETRRTA